MRAAPDRPALRRIVYVSTIGVHGDASNGTALDESSPIQPLNAYARSKVRAEAALRAESAHGSELAIVRPPLVYGAGVPGNLPRLLRLVASGVPLPLASVRNLRSLVAVENLVDALVLCGNQAAAAGQAYVIADGEDLSTPELVRTLALGLGVPARLVPVPPAALRLAARLAGREALYRQLGGSLQVDARKLRTELGWLPRVDARSALLETARWYARVRSRRARPPGLNRGSIRPQRDSPACRRRQRAPRPRAARRRRLRSSPREPGR